MSGSHEGATGMVVKVDGDVLIIISDTTKEHIRVFADHVVESSEVTTSVTKLGDYELHDLVLLDNMSFGVIIWVESDAFQVLKGVPDRPEVVLIRLREIKSKIDKKLVAQDRSKNTVSVKDVVRVLEGPCKGKQGPVTQIFRGVLFIFDRHHLEHAGFICVKSRSCLVVDGSKGNRDKMAIANDVVLSKCKIIDEPWDCGGLYLVGKFNNWDRSIHIKLNIRPLFYFSNVSFDICKFQQTAALPVLS